MTDEEIRLCRKLIKDNILHYLTDDWNNHKRGKAHKENQALFDRKDGYPKWSNIDLKMVMEKVVNGIWSANLEQLKEQNK